MNEKPILSIETSDVQCAACIYFDDKKFVETSVNFKNRHSQLILDVIDKTVSLADIELKDLNWIAVSGGPGSFTGLRIGLSSAKGLAVGLNLSIVLVPTFEALAFQILDGNDLIQDLSIANKINNEELYFARFINNGNIPKFAEELQIIKKEELKIKSKSSTIVGNFDIPEIRKSNLSGTPSAFYIAKWSKRFGENLALKNFDLLEPLYLKDFLIKGKKK